MPPPRLLVIGAGNMARAILSGAFHAGALAPLDVLAAEPDPGARARIESLRVRAVAHAHEALQLAPASTPILLAVKPQSLPDVARDCLSSSIPVGDRVVVSILAGAPSAAVRAALGGAARIVRVMPNTPAQIGRGVAGVALGAGSRPGDDALARTLFSSVGDVVPIDERLMDAFTAVVGSGPAYVFLLAEAMTAAARAVGFDAAVADRIARATVSGAAELMARDTRTPDDLRAAVTSKGGTTAAAMDVFERAGFTDTVVRAITAARDRGAELAKHAGGASPASPA
jgi:pyrroline-5-carboxylate reductase